MLPQNPHMINKMMCSDIIPINYHPRNYAMPTNPRMPNHHSPMINFHHPHMLDNPPYQVTPRFHPPQNNVMIPPPYQRNLMVRIPNPPNYQYIPQHEEAKFMNYYPEFQKQAMYEECYMAHSTPCCPHCYNHYLVIFY